jgi:hypothetical protein
MTEVRGEMAGLVNAMKERVRVVRQAAATEIQCVATELDSDIQRMVASLRDELLSIINSVQLRLEGREGTAR